MFVGEKRRAALEDLVDAFDRAQHQKRPQFVLIEAETGLGKTRLIQELYSRLARDRQGLPPYWPDRLDTRTSGDVLRDRKTIVPSLPFTIAGGAPLTYVWWGVLCLDTDDGVPVPRLAESARQFEFHATHLLEARSDHLDTALTLAQEVIGVVGLANPIQLAVSALDAAKTSASWLQRWRRKSAAQDELSADRHIDIGKLGDDERAVRLAGAVRTASNAGLTVVVVVDDAHCADPTMISFLRQLAQIESGSVLIVAAGWPSEIRRRIDSTTGTVGALLASTRQLMTDRFTLIELDKLEDRDVAQLLLEVAPNTTPEIIDSFAAVIDGNPLLLRLYLDLDVIRRDIKEDGRLDTDPAVFGRLPADAKAVWQELWRQLPESTRLALAVVSIQGPRFHPSFLNRAATDLKDWSISQAGIGAAQDTFGWVIPSDGELSAFTERLRYEVAYDNQSQQLDPSQVTVVHKALVAHATEIKSTSEWLMISIDSKRAILRSHVAIVKANPSVGDVAAAASSAFDLSLLEEAAGDHVSAAAAARDAVELAQAATGVADDEMIAYRTRLGLLERDAGNDQAAFEAISAAEELSRVASDVDPTTTELLAKEIAGLAPVPEATAQDAPRPWVGWQARAVPGIFEQPTAVMAELITEITRAEGPITVGRLSKLIGQATDAKRVGRVMFEHLEHAAGVAARRNEITNTAPYKACAGTDRILSVAGSPTVNIRERGSRDFEQIPITELAGVAAWQLRDNPKANIEILRRSIMSAYGAKRLTDNVTATLNRAITIARRERDKAARDDKVWADAHSAISRIPVGYWTSVADLAEFAHTSSGWVGRHFYGKWDLVGLHRVLEADGAPWRWFHWPLDHDQGDVAAVLRAEGAIATDGRGDPSRHLDADGLRGLL